MTLILSGDLSEAFDRRSGPFATSRHRGGAQSGNILIEALYLLASRRRAAADASQRDAVLLVSEAVRR